MSEKITAEEISKIAQKTGLSEEVIRDRFSSMGVKEESTLSSALDKIGRGLDWTGGVTRTGIASLIDPLTEKELVKEGDWGNALVGKAPSSDEILGRSGMEEGMLRSGLGFAGDVLLDPSIALSGAAKGIGSLGKLAGSAKAVEAAQALGKFAPKLDIGGNLMFNPLTERITKPISEGASKGLNKLGKWAYETSTMRSLDDAAKMVNPNAVKPSDILYEEGIWGKNPTVFNEVLGEGGLTSKLLGKRKEILSSEAGLAPVNADKILSDFQSKNKGLFDVNAAEGRNILDKEAYEGAKKMGQDILAPLRKKDILEEVPTVIPRKEPLSYMEQMQSSGAYTPIEMGSKVVKVGEVPTGNVAQLSDILSSLNKTIGESAYGMGKIPSDSIAQVKDLAKAAREEMYSAATKGNLEEGLALKDINEKVSSLLSARNKLKAEASKTAQKKVLTAVDAGLLGANPLVGATKKIGEILGTSAFGTGTGQALRKASKAVSRQDAEWNMLLDSLGRQTLDDRLKEE